MYPPIYLDYNATTPVDPEVVNEMLPYFQTHFGNPSNSYGLGRHNKQAIEKARSQLAELIGALPEEIVFTSCGTESNNLAIRGIAFANQEKGKHIITSSIEHPAVTEVCHYLASRGWEITYLPVDKYGTVNSEDVKKAIRNETVLISIIHANNEVGPVQPIAEIAAFAKENNIIFHTDASQSVGKFESNVNVLGVDLLTIAGDKLYAPKGIGALYIRKGVNIEKLMFGAGHEMGMRPGTVNVPYIIGLGKACELARENDIMINEHFFRMRQRLLNGLKQKSGSPITVNINLENCLSNTLSISFASIEAHALTSVIGEQVCISTGSTCRAQTGGWHSSHFNRKVYN